jgi:hypothetical protein
VSKLIPETIDSIKSFMETLNNVEKDWDSVYDDIGKCDQEISDLLHEIELTEFDHAEGNKLSEEIQKVRRRRRELKNYQEIMRHIKEFLERNKSLKMSLFRVLSSMERTRDYQMNRTYTPRVRTDLKLCSKENQNMMHQQTEFEEETEVYDDTVSVPPVALELPSGEIDVNDSNEEQEVSGDVRPRPFRSFESFKETEA